LAVIVYSTKLIVKGEKTIASLGIGNPVFFLETYFLGFY